MTPRDMGERIGRAFALVCRIIVVAAAAHYLWSLR
jgi:hypothetical protein